MNKRGMTLIEMIAALAILSIASLTLFGGFSAVLKIMGNSSTIKNNSDMLLSYAEETTVSYTHLDVYKRQVQLCMDTLLTSRY